MSQQPTKPTSGSWRRDAEALLEMGAKTIDAATVRGLLDRIQELENEIADGWLGKHKEYFPTVAHLTRRNRDMHDRAQRAESRTAKLEAALRRIRDQEPHERPWINARLIANEALGGTGMPSSKESK